MLPPYLECSERFAKRPVRADNDGLAGRLSRTAQASLLLINHAARWPLIELWVSSRTARSTECETSAFIA